VDTPEVFNDKKARRDAARLETSVEDVREKGKQASAFVKNLITKYKDQAENLELDKKERDKYGRLLGYLWFKDGKMLNEEIIKAGYGTTMVIPPNSKYYDRFQELEKQAKEKKIGIWKD